MFTPSGPSHTVPGTHTHTHSDTTPAHTQAHSPLTGDRCQKQARGSRGPVGHRRDRRDSFPDSRAGTLLGKGVLQEEETPRGAAPPTSEGCSFSPPRGRSWNRVELGAGSGRGGSWGAGLGVAVLRAALWPSGWGSDPEPSNRGAAAGGAEVPSQAGRKRAPRAVRKARWHTQLSRSACPSSGRTSQLGAKHPEGREGGRPAPLYPSDLGGFLRAPAIPSCLTLQPRGLGVCPAPLSMDPPGENTGVGHLRNGLADSGSVSAEAEAGLLGTFQLSPSSPDSSLSGP